MAREPAGSIPGGTFATVDDPGPGEGKEAVGQN
jgi:hypothetical protein